MAVYLRVDTSDAQALIEKMKAVHTQKEFELLMYRAFRRTGAKVKTILATEIPKSYEVNPSSVRRTVGAPRTPFGGGAAVNCCIPIDGKRHSIGGEFSARGGARGWNVIKGRRYKITARIIRGTTSTLPEEMKNIGDEPPFRNYSAPTLNRVAFSRKGKGRLPIQKIVGIGIPQMPMNRSKDDVQDEIVTHLMGRIEHEHRYLINRCR